MATDATCLTQPNNNKQMILDMLVSSVSCGDPELAQTLTDNAEMIYMLNRGCYAEVDYLQAQLAMLDLAMIFSRNKVDESRTRARSTGFDQFRSKFENEAKAQRTSESRSCGFGNATSFQTFQRDSVNRSRSQSDMESNASGNTQTTRWDRSTQSASGFSHIYDYANSASEGDGRGSHIDTQSNAGKSYSKTSRDFGPQLNDLDTGSLVADLPTAQEAWDSVSGGAKWRTIRSILEGGGITEWITDVVVMPIVDESDFRDNISDNFNSEGTKNIPLDPFLDCCCDLDSNPLTQCPDDPNAIEGVPNCNYDYYEPFPSYGRGWNVKYNLSLGVPFIGVLRVDWGEGEQFRQSHTVTQGCTRSVGEGSTVNRYEQVDGSKSIGGTNTHDTASTVRDIHTIGDSYRDARADTTAGSASTGDAHSESHTGSDRSSHSERRASNQGTAWSKGRGRGSGLSTSDSHSKTEMRKWSQIFKNLTDMYTRVFDQIRQYNRIRALSVGVDIKPIVGQCQYSLPVDPICSAILRRRSGLTKVYQ